MSYPQGHLVLTTPSACTPAKETMQGERPKASVGGRPGTQRWELRVRLRRNGGGGQQTPRSLLWGQLGHRAHF